MTEKRPVILAPGHGGRGVGLGRQAASYIVERGLVLFPEPSEAVHLRRKSDTGMP